MLDKKKIKPRYIYLGSSISKDSEVTAIIADTYKINLEFLAGKFNIEAVNVERFISSKAEKGIFFEGIESMSIADLKKKSEELKGKDNITELQKAIKELEPLAKAMKLGGEVDLVEIDPSSYELKKVTRENIPKTPQPR